MALDARGGHYPASAACLRPTACHGRTGGLFDRLHHRLCADANLPADSSVKLSTLMFVVFPSVASQNTSLPSVGEWEECCDDSRGRATSAVSYLPPCVSAKHTLVSTEWLNGLTKSPVSERRLAGRAMARGHPLFGVPRPHARFSHLGQGMGGAHATSPLASLKAAKATRFRPPRTPGFQPTTS